jgi:hypothetical protein
MPVHRAPPDDNPTNRPTEHDKRALLSQSDPPGDARAGRRTPILLIIIVALLVTAVVVLHLAGVVGHGSH